MGEVPVADAAALAWPLTQGEKLPLEVEALQEVPRLCPGPVWPPR